MARQKWTEADHAKEIARVLRRMAGRHIKRAAALAEQADLLDPPPPQPDVSRTVCRSCGAEYVGREYRSGQSCESCEWKGQTGYLMRAPERTAVRADEVKTDTLSCDVCGHQIGGAGPEFDNLECRTVGWDTSGTAIVCPGHYRFNPDPDEPLTTMYGQSLGVTRNVLAASQAGQDATAEWLMQVDLDELSDLSDDRLDIAATFAGRQA